MTRLRLFVALLVSLAPPTNAWITNGGTLFNQRYSPLSSAEVIAVT
jgi:hypothetical protein